MQPRGATDRRLAALAHAAGLLGLSIGGWVVAAAVSVGLLFLAERHRSRFLAIQAGQSALYHIAVFALHLLVLLWLAAGFLSFGGELPGVEDWRIFDGLADPWLTIIQVIWGLTLVSWPVFYLGTVGYAMLGAWRTLRGEAFWYPLVSRPVRRQFEHRPAVTPEDTRDDSADGTLDVANPADVPEERPAV